ncbi:MAG: CBASS cGAMP-activated phospholipase [Litorimonas sp.]
MDGLAIDTEAADETGPPFADTKPIRRVLSIDGGGIKGVFACAFLAQIEEYLESEGKDPRLHTYFDLMAGTSTGGIITIGLGMGFSARQILEMYVSRGSAIFAQDQRGSSGLWQRFKTKRNVLSGPSYSTHALENALRSLLQNRLLGQAKTRLVIPSVHADTLEPYIFKTRHSARFARDHTEPAVTAALATAAAPTFFSGHTTASGVATIDGGIAANNPVAIAVSEAVGELGWPREDIRVLSISCTTEPTSLRVDTKKLDMAFGAGIAKVMAAQSKMAIGMAHILLGDHGGNDHKAIYRVDEVVEPGRYSLDKTSEIAGLKSLGSAKARIRSADLASIFFTQTAEPFDPVTGN